MANGNQIDVKIAGNSFIGFRSIRVSRSLRDYSGEFSLSASVDFPSKVGNAPILGGIAKVGLPSNINSAIPAGHFGLGDEIAISAFGTIILTGYIDQIDINYSSSSYLVEYRGRDKTADLVDCSVDIDDENNEFKGLSALSIITALVDPFGINVNVDDVGLISKLVNPREMEPSWNATPGDTVHQHINRILNKFGAMAYSDGDGELKIERKGAFTTGNPLGVSLGFDIPKLEGGVNVLSSSFNQSDRDLHNKYIALGTEASLNGSSRKAPKSVTTLPIFGNGRERTLTVIDENLKDNDACKDRVEMEAKQRTGAARNLLVKVQGWDYKEDVYKVGQIIDYTDPLVGSVGKKLVASISYNLDDSSGTTTDMALVNPSMFTVNGTKVKKEEVEDAFARLNRNLTAVGL